MSAATIKKPTTAANTRLRRPRAPWWLRVVKAVLLTALGIILFLVGTLITTLSILTPDRLTVLVQRAAESQLQNARVSVGRVELTTGNSLLNLHLNVDSLYVISSISAGLPSRDGIPAYADTVFGMAHLDGGVSMAALALNKLSISDVNIVNPVVNYVVFNDSLTNFDILKPSPSPEPSKPFDWKTLPRIHLKRFALVDPQPVRYYDVATGTAITAIFERVFIDGEHDPRYTLRFGGDVESPRLMRYFRLGRVTFGLDGDMVWDQKDPWRLAVTDMSAQLALIKGVLNIDIDASRGLVLNRLDVDLEPIPIAGVLDLLPDTLKASYGIPEGIETTACVKLDGRLSQPFVVGDEALPAAVVSIKIPDSEFRWQRVRFDNLAADITLDLPGDNLNDIVVNIERLNIKGPATDLTLAGTLTSVADDPLFDGSLRGTCDLAKLPPILMSQMPGSLSGRLTADAVMKGRPSMFSFGGYHRLLINGKMDFKDVYWISPDTMNMAYIKHADFIFGTNTDVKNRQGARVDSLLAAVIHVDSASILHSDIEMHLGDFRMGLGAVNRSLNSGASHNRQVIPMGGGLHIGQFNLMVLSDTVVARFREVDGKAVIRAHNNDMHTPELSFDLGISRFSTGNRTTRFLLNDTHAKFVTFLKPQTRRAQQIKEISDSISRIRPDIPLDSIYDIALELHRRRARHGFPRVHPRLENDSLEVIDWGTSKFLNRFLTGWRIDGTLTAHRAGLFTPAFPLRNRLLNLDVTFNNDSVLLRHLDYKVGHSDFTLNGNITNVRRALTSRNYSQPLRVNLSVVSDTIDINQLAETAFSGAAYLANGEDKKKHHSSLDLTDINDESALERAIGEHVQNAPDSMAPLLIPQNVEAEFTVHATNVRYSDLALKNLNGKLLTYEGALNIHDLSAQSDIGSVSLSALYVGRDPRDLQFGFGLKVNDFNLHGFLDLMPAVDSIMPLLRDFSGIISADIAATTQITPGMDLDLASLNAAIRLSGDSLVLIDPDTFSSLSRWLLFRDKKRNIIDHMSVEVLVKDRQMQLFPFIFDIDRYRLGVQGTNDFALNFNYHIAVLKSPIPFKFGINISGNPDKYKIRLGGAKFHENSHVDVAVVDTTRVNLINSIENVFRRGVSRARFAHLNVDNVAGAAKIDLSQDTLTHLDSLRYIQEGLIPAPDTIPANVGDRKSTKANRKKRKDTVQTLTQSLSPVAAVVPVAVRRRRD